MPNPQSESPSAVPDPIPPARAPVNRKSGTLSLFLPPNLVPAEAALAPPAPYARLRLRRGFLDDLNRILPIRARIRLEGEVAQGLSRGEVEAPVRFRWEFAER